MRLLLCEDEEDILYALAKGLKNSTTTLILLRMAKKPYIYTTRTPMTSLFSI